MYATSSDLYLETDGARLRYRDEGQGGTVILVHGWTLDLEMWDAQAEALARSFRVVRLDRRGFGLSSGLPSVAGDAADLSAVCKHLEVDFAALVGMSQGARSVLQFAGSFPRSISCIVLDGPPHLGAPNSTSGSHNIPYEYYRELARIQGLSAFRREWSQHALVRLKTADPGAHALLARMIARYPGKDLAGAAVDSEASAPAHSFEPLDCPVLVVNGEFDLDSRKRSARQLTSQFRRAEYLEIPNAGHLCNLDNPRAYNDALRRFFELYATPPISH